MGLDAEETAMRLRGLASLCAGWGVYRAEVGDPGPEGNAQVMEVLRWALDALAAQLEPPDPGEPLPEAPRIPDSPDELLRG